MKRFSRRERLYAGIFVVALIWGGWNYRQMFFSSKPDPKPARPAAAASIPGTATTMARQVPEPATRTHYVAPEWMGDPFNRTWRFTQAITVQKPRPKPLPLQLTAVVVRPGKRYAVINGQIVRVGQSIAGRRVLAIEESEVRVDDNGVEVTLTL